MTIKAIFTWTMLLVCTCDAFAADAYDPTTSHKTDFATVAFSWHDLARDREIPIKIYYPKEMTDKTPVILFSHGLGGSRDGYSYVGEGWASHGYVSIHLTHEGTDTKAIMAAGVTHVREQARTLATDPRQAVDRCRDISFAIDQLKILNREDQSPLKGHLDLDRVAIAGHSFGANTTMLTSGEITRTGKSFADDRIKCAIAMSPPVAVPESQYEKVYSEFAVPLFVMTGTKDDSPVGETKAIQRRVPFDHVSKSPAYLLTLTGGDHMVFSDRRQSATDERFHDLILRGSIAFWDAYLRDDDAAKKWLKDGGYEKAVGDSGKFEEKNVK